MKGSFTHAELLALEQGAATIYRGRVIPIIRGGDGSDAGGDGGNNEDGGKGDGAGGAGGDRTFSQADVDRIVQERVARAKATPPADYDDLKTKAAEFDKLQEANKSELDREREARAAAEKERDDAKTAAKETSLRASVIAEAAKKNVVDPDAAYALLDRATLNLDADGNPTNIADAMDSLLKAKPYLVGGGTRTDGADQGARTNGAKQLSTTDGMSADEITAALAEGRLDTYLSTPN